jgi:hypothetical protein
LAEVASRVSNEIAETDVIYETSNSNSSQGLNRRSLITH